MKKTKKFRWLSVLLAILLSIAFVFAGCGNSAQTDEDQAQETLSGVETKSGSTTYPLKIKDDVGEVEFDKAPEKIVSLSPACTESLFAIGAGDEVVGDTEYCNYPEQAQSIEKVGSFSEPNVEKILSLDPDLIVTNSNLSDDARKQLENAGMKVFVADPKTVTDVQKYLVNLGEILNKNDNAAKVVNNMQTELNDIVDKLKDVENEKSVFVDLGSYYTVGPGSLLNNELENLKAVNIAGNSDSAYPVLTTEQIIKDNPDVYISLYTPLSDLQKVPGFDQINAFKNNQVYSYSDVSENADMISRPGPRVVDGMKILAQDIYPDQFQ